jgi:4'-phosphopantetheinyl transferase
MSSAPEAAAFPSEGELHLWCLSLRQLPLAPNLARLSDAERQRAERFARREDFERFVQSHGALRLVLAACSGRPIGSIELTEDPRGKPRLRDGALEFNLSHSGGYVLIGVGRAPLGVDIESVEREIDWRGIAARWFHPRERAALFASPDAEQRDAFFQIWTQKEAYLKAIGRGLAGNLADFATAARGGAVETNAAAGTHGAWHISRLAAPAGYEAAAAAPFPIDGRNLVMRMALPTAAA